MNRDGDSEAEGDGQKKIRQRGEKKNDVREMIREGATAL